LRRYIKEWCTNNHINLRAMMKTLDIYKQLSRAAVGEAEGVLRTHTPPMLSRQPGSAHLYEHTP
jgi:hypothetical protein